MASEYISAGVPFLRSQNVEPLRINGDDLKFISREFHGRLRKSSLQPGDVVIVRTGKPGACAVIPESLPEANCSDLVIVRCGKDLDPKFLSYFVNSVAAHHIGSHLVGAVQQHFNVGSARKMRIVAPDVREQRAIASILGALDDKIELNRRMNETLEAMARALFKSWFVDFDPVRARAEGRSFVLPQEIASYVPETFEETELGLVPNGWCVVSVGELCSRVAMGPFGSDIKTDNFVEAGVPVVRGSNLVDGFVEEAFVFLTEQKADELRNANAFPGNIVITHRGTLGQVGLIPIGSRFPRYVVSQSQMLLAVDMAVATPRYLYEFLRSAFGQHSLLANTSQTGVPAIARPTTSVKAIRIVKPPIEVLRGFDKVVDPLYTRRDHCVSESRTLANLRDTLLPKLISGALRVKAAEKIVEAVA
ncbi:restriction endonuclease subunit S [Bradyrhizobium sp. HKCCYLS2033]|uniref:restriction endonuclease subunit S n=1 Tax=Bradyrhizobium sp. HKCCYLS2033 TaxID=3420739 RepID=UPI003EC01A70